MSTAVVGLSSTQKMGDDGDGQQVCWMGVWAPGPEGWVVDNVVDHPDNGDDRNGW